MTTNTQRRANLLFALLFVLKKIRKMLWLRTGNRKVKAMKKENNMIELIGVTKQFGDMTAVNHINLIYDILRSFRLWQDDYPPYDCRI